MTQIKFFSANVRTHEKTLAIQERAKMRHIKKGVKAAANGYDTDCAAEKHRKAADPGNDVDRSRFSTQVFSADPHPSSRKLLASFSANHLRHIWISLIQSKIAY